MMGDDTARRIKREDGPKIMLPLAIPCLRTREAGKLAGFFENNSMRPAKAKPKSLKHGGNGGKTRGFGGCEARPALPFLRGITVMPALPHIPQNPLVLILRSLRVSGFDFDLRAPRTSRLCRAPAPSAPGTSLRRPRVRPWPRGCGDGDGPVR